MRAEAHKQASRLDGAREALRGGPGCHNAPAAAVDPCQGSEDRGKNQHLMRKQRGRREVADGGRRQEAARADAAGSHTPRRKRSRTNVPGTRSSAPTRPRRHPGQASAGGHPPYSVEKTLRQNPTPAEKGGLPSSPLRPLAPPHPTRRHHHLQFGIHAIAPRQCNSLVQRMQPLPDVNCMMRIQEWRGAARR